MTHSRRTTALLVRSKLPLVFTRINMEIFRISPLAETEGNLGGVQAL